MLSAFSTALIFTFAWASVFCKCPANDSEVLSPCTCESDVLRCEEFDRDLKQYFAVLSSNLTDQDKHFKAIELRRFHLDNLEANTFQDLLFDEIKILNVSIGAIDQDAFTGTDQVCKSLVLYDLNLKSHDGFFGIINKFAKLKYLRISETYIDAIPANAFNEQDHLEMVWISETKLKQIGPRAFAKLNNLKDIYLHETIIEVITDEMFTFENSSDIKLNVEFSQNSLLNPGTSFTPRSFIGINRPTTIIMYDPILTFLDEKAFKPFLNDNQDNVIDIGRFNKLDCHDPRNSWLESVPTERVTDIYCTWTNDTTTTPKPSNNASMNKNIYQFITFITHAILIINMLV